MADMVGMLDFLANGKVKELSAEDAAALADAAGGASGLRIYAPSAVGAWGSVYLAGVGKDDSRHVVRLFKSEGEARLGPYAVESLSWSEKQWRDLKENVPFLSPVRLGSGTSAGLGDRLGLATPAHTRAAKHTGIVPALAQQSMREMSRTGRTPLDVVMDAAWGVWISGWRDAWGADADHLKTIEDVDKCAVAGFVMYTIDPGAHVDDAAATDDAATLKRKVGALPWGKLETTQKDCRARHVNSPEDEEAFSRAAAKYAAAVAHTASVARHIASRFPGGEYELEVSVDETDSPTSPFEHRFVAVELQRMGITPDSLAVRFVGDFEKGVDYKGDLSQLAKEAKGHAAVAREIGPYKLSVHSGSDKFSAYPPIAEATHGAVHLKTAGTSWLEAVRAIGEIDLDLFKEIAGVARSRYDEDRKSYHVSGVAADLPPMGQITADVARRLLDDPGARQVFHVTYGSVLAAKAPGGGTLGEALKKCLSRNEETHWRTVAKHIERHLAPFARVT